MNTFYMYCSLWTAEGEPVPVIYNSPLGKYLNWKIIKHRSALHLKTGKRRI